MLPPATAAVTLRERERSVARGFVVVIGAGGEAHGADNEQGIVQHEHGGARGEAGAVPRHRDALHRQPQSEPYTSTYHSMYHAPTRTPPPSPTAVCLPVCYVPVFIDSTW